MDSIQARLTRTDVGSAVVLLVVAAVVAVVGASRPWLALPVTATFTLPPAPPSEGTAELVLAEVPVEIAVVHLPTAVAVLLVYLAVVRFLSILPPIRARRLAAVAADHHLVRWIEFSQTSGIVVFLVAQLNGITEVTSLVPLYALGAASVLLLVLHDRRTDEGRAGLWAFSFGTVVAIIPWGVVAFAQIGGTLAGVGGSVLVRVATVLALLGIAAVWFGPWLHGRGPRSGVGPRVELGLSGTIVLAPAVLAVTAVLG